MKDVSPKAYNGKSSPRFIFFMIFGTICFVSAVLYAINRKPVKNNGLNSLKAEVEHSLTLQGSNTMGEKLVPELVKGWLAKSNIQDIDISKSNNLDTLKYYDSKGNAGLVVIKASSSEAVFPTSSSDGKLGITADNCDIGLSSRKITTRELNLVEKAGHGKLNTPRTEIAVALDGIAIITHSSNQIRSLTLNEAARIYSGEITDWSQLDLKKGPIRIYIREKKSGTSKTFNNAVMKKYGKTWASTLNTVKTNSSLIKMVSEDKQAIGFSSYAKCNSTVKIVPLQSCNSCLPVPPNDLTIRAGEYPLTRTLYFYAPEIGRSAIAEEFLHYARSESAVDVITHSGFVSPRSLKSNNTEIKNYENELYANLTLPTHYRSIAQFWDRSHTGFNARFNSNTDTLDSESLDKLKQVSLLLKQDHYKGYQLAFVGHSCKSLGPTAEKDAEKLAKIVQNWFKKTGVQKTALFSFGGEMTVADSKSLEGRNINRRVEIWMRRPQSED